MYGIYSKMYAVLVAEEEKAITSERSSSRVDLGQIDTPHPECKHQKEVGLTTPYPEYIASVLRRSWRSGYTPGQECNSGRCRPIKYYIPHD